MLLDTNVVSETMKAQPDAAVAGFLARQHLATLFIPSLVVAELRYGIARLPGGQRRRGLEAALDAFLRQGFNNRVLAFDAACAASYAIVRAARETAGRPVAVQDALIGAMALTHGATLVTRNTGDFDGYGLTLIDPWQAPGQAG